MGVVDSYTINVLNGILMLKTPLLTEFKKHNEFLKECDNAALAYSRSNFERAIKDFIKSKKKNNEKEND